MNILLLGSGGREAAIAYKMLQSNDILNLIVAPGNAQTGEIATNADINPTDFDSIKEFCLSESIDMVIVGPEEPLVRGIVDFFDNEPTIKHIPVIGPDKMGAELEGSKDYAKQFMTKHSIPTATYRTFDATNIDEGCLFIDLLTPPYVLKADGLAAGKGVVILKDKDEAKAELRRMIEEQKFGTASAKVVIEEFLKGVEISVFIITDGVNYKILPSAKDYKRIGEGDTGLNTGGMGSVSPVPFADDEFMKKVEDRIIRPTVDGLKSEKIAYRGFIFFGLIVVEGNPFVIEYNCRMGDPETESVFPRITSDVVEMFKATANGTLDQYEMTTDPRTVASVMLVSKGYPEDYEKGKVITGIDKVNDSIVFQAGTKHDGNKIVTNGGRVLTVTSFGCDMKEALSLSYSNAEKIHFEGVTYRHDIGFDL